MAHRGSLGDREHLGDLAIGELFKHPEEQADSSLLGKPHERGKHSVIKCSPVRPQHSGGGDRRDVLNHRSVGLRGMLLVVRGASVPLSRGVERDETDNLGHPRVE